MNNIESRRTNSAKKFSQNDIRNNESYSFSQAQSTSSDSAVYASSSSHLEHSEDNIFTDGFPVSSHTLQSSSSLLIPTPSTIVCRYFQNGQCRYGALCRFSHDLELVQLPIEQQSITSSQSDRADSSNINTEFKEETAGVYEKLTQNLNGERIIPTDPDSWINAPVFVPKHLGLSSEVALTPDHSSDNYPKSYAQIVLGNIDDTKLSTYEYSSMLCPYIKGVPVVNENNNETYICPYGDQCMYQHALLCDMCSNYCLHPTDEEQRKQHRIDCIKQHERDMELSFAIARSKDKTCGVCFEVVREKSGRAKRFGILPNCNHIFCLECIRKWRQAKQFDNNIIRACPECRISSDFVCPSLYWVETKEEKDKLINEYKDALGKQNCKYFKQGSGKCPFGNKCFYKHATPDGKLVDVGVPQRERPRRRVNDGGETDVFQRLLLWNFLDARENLLIDDLISFISENESDFSDSDVFEIEF